MLFGLEAKRWVKQFLQGSDSFVILVYLRGFSKFLLNSSAYSQVSFRWVRNYESCNEMFTDQIKVEPAIHSAPIISYMTKEDWFDLKQFPHHGKPAVELQQQKKCIPFNYPQLPTAAPSSTNPHWQKATCAFILISPRVDCVKLGNKKIKNKKAPPQAMKKKKFFFHPTYSQWKCSCQPRSES